MTQQEMQKLGAMHAERGGKLTPNECESVDKAIFKAIETMDKFEGARFYNQMRGAFNKGWDKAYAAMVCA